MMHELDEFENLVRHEDFVKILHLAGILKGLKSRLLAFADHRKIYGGISAPSSSAEQTPRRLLHPQQGEHTPSTSNQTDTTEIDANGVRSITQHGRSREHHSPKSIERAADLIRSTFPPLQEESSNYCSSNTIGRGEYPITDSLIDETIKSLADELRRYRELKKQLIDTTYPRLISPPDADILGNFEVDDKNHPIAPKFAKWQTDILNEWMIEHRERPFPDQIDVVKLSRMTSLDHSQIVHWVTNVRARNMKAVIEKEKKPHHFLDYLFLATDREKQIKKMNNSKMLTIHNSSAPAPAPASTPLRHPLTVISSESSAKGTLEPLNSSNLVSKNSKMVQTRFTYPPPPVHPPSSISDPSTKLSKSLHRPPSTVKPMALPHAPLPRQEAMSQSKQIHHLITPRPMLHTQPSQNVGHIFRRGKQIQNMISTGKTIEEASPFVNLQLPDSPDLLPTNWSYGSMYEDDRGFRKERNQNFSTREREILENYLNYDIIETPESSFDDCSFSSGGIDEHIFEEYFIPPIRRVNGHIRGPVPSESDSFNVKFILEVPYDESEKDYLRGLM